MQQFQSLSGNIVTRTMQNLQGHELMNYSIQKKLEFGF